jgi:ribosomal protein S18 acetylase RimI-like enzyme
MNPEKITFKKVLPEDWEKFKTIRLKGLQTDPQAFGGNFEAESQEDEAYWRERLNSERCLYAAQEDASFVAIVGAKKITQDNWMLISVYTLPEFRGKGLSKELMSRLIEGVKANGAKKISLMVNVGQRSAINLYKKMGFEILRTEKDQRLGDGNTYDEFYMEKAI